MPGAKTHMIIAALLCAGLYLVGLPVTEPKQILITVFIIIIYSQIPDMDHQSSKITRFITAAGIITALYYLYKGDTFTVWVLLLPLAIIWGLRFLKLIKHRGLFHHAIVQGILAFPVYYLLGLTPFVYATTAAISHVAADHIQTTMKKKKDKKKNGKGKF